MKKKFNITGVCYPHLHYMMDNSQKVKKALAMVEDGDYFVINRPRQYGKTTMLFFLSDALENSDDYFPFRLNFQGIDAKWHESDQAFAKMFISQLESYFQFSETESYELIQELAATVSDMNTLSKAITTLMHHFEKKVVLLIDEVDASSNFDSFLSFLAMLRTKYLDRFSPRHKTFHSVILAGVHDIKTLKSKIRDTAESQYNSPWNIAADFKVEMSFRPEEIAPMLEAYGQAEDVEIDIPAFSEKLYYYTSGYPFLVSKLCKIIAEDILPGKEEKKWSMDDLEAAIQLLLKQGNTNFDSLIKNLENNKELYDLVNRLLVDGDSIPFNLHNPTIHLGFIYGIFSKNGTLKIHNRIYEQLIYAYMISKTLTAISSENIFAGHFTLPNNELDLKAALLRFQLFMKEQHSEKNTSFLESEGRLVFLSYLAPILNGQGYAFREVQTSQEKRLDIVVTYFQHKYIIELKRWYGPKMHENGLDLLAEYLDFHSVDQGFLLIFDHRKEKEWKQEAILHKGKEIFAVWV